MNGIHKSGEENDRNDRNEVCESDSRVEHSFISEEDNRGYSAYGF